MSARLESLLDTDTRARCAANDLAIEVSIYDAYDNYSSYARNSLMAAHFPQQLEAERAARFCAPHTPEFEQSVREYLAKFGSSQ